jgi:hypothetical protein
VLVRRTIARRGLVGDPVTRLATTANAPEDVRPSVGASAALGSGAPHVQRRLADPAPVVEGAGPRAAGDDASGSSISAAPRDSTANDATSGSQSTPPPTTALGRYAETIPALDALVSDFRRAAR